MNYILPNKPDNCHMSDRDWETDQMLVWCVNSLKSWEGYLQTMLGNHQDLSFENKLALQEHLHRAQNVILMLLDETGRLDEYREHVEKGGENTYGNGIK